MLLKIGSDELNYDFNKTIKSNVGNPRPRPRLAQRNEDVLNLRL